MEDNKKKQGAIVKSIAESVSKTIATQIMLKGFTELTKIAENKLTVYIEVPSYLAGYLNIMNELHRMNPVIFNRNRLLTGSDGPADNELAIGTKYMLRLDQKTYCIVSVCRLKVEAHHDRTVVLSLRIFGQNRYKWRRHFSRTSTINQDVSKIRIRETGYNSDYIDVRPRTFDTIVLNDDVRYRIINGLMKWKMSKEWYLNHHLVYKIGVFLYGAPGTGKSTIVRAISTMFDNIPIYAVNMNNVKSSVNYIVDQRMHMRGYMIVLLEDFDFFFKNRNESKRLGSDKPGVCDTTIEAFYNESNADQQYLFQMLDGVYSTDKTIYIATTNHIDVLDPALIRYGRFDIQEELTYFTKDQALEAVKLFGYDETFLDKLEIEYPVQPALLQAKIMEERSSEI